MSLYPLYNNTRCRVNNEFIQKKIKFYKSLVPEKYRNISSSLCSKHLSLISMDNSSGKLLHISEIHGDLTFHNCSLNARDIMFYDVDRFENCFPEFDLFTIYIDSQFNYINRSTRNQLDLASSLQMDSKLASFLSIFYDKNKFFYPNSSSLSLIFNLYFVRTVCYMLNDASFNPNIINSLNQS